MVPLQPLFEEQRLQVLVNMAGIHVFNVEFGFNATPLTVALEEGNVIQAERLIKQCTTPSYLDEGCYQRIPLFIVLCGENEMFEAKTRDFYLAKLLLQYGANPNYRIPETDSSEYVSRGKAPLELMVDFYIELITREETKNYKPFQKVVGLENSQLSKTRDILQEILEMISVLLAFGADVNVTNDDQETPLLRILQHSCSDLELVSLLCENGANPNAIGTMYSYSSVFCLCTCPSHVSFKDLARSMSSHTCHRDQQFAILKTHDVDLEIKTKAGQTVIFRALQEGHFTVSRLLLQNGASVGEPNIMLGLRNQRERHSISMVDLTPFFGYVISSEVQQELLNFPTTNSLQQMGIASLVDSGLFPLGVLFNDLKSIILGGFPEYNELLLVGRERLFPLLFGYTSAGLKQIIARKIFQLITKTDGLTITQLTEREEPVERSWLLEWLGELHLPLDILMNFRLECFRYRMLYGLREQILKDIWTDTLPFSSEFFDDSDLEYW
ncbi:uncharacterized protein LOC141898400 isoform X1 [Tubulanus polymorphus]|uniref:uncharacterized protein LOC141898400 isoform X1 n=1 Tax=Tubulanus polymorphus TaxID=672921 RepID=UPI003DA387E2